jgi:arylsulfatase
VRVPAIFAWPGMIDAERTSDGLFSFSDFLPTMLSLAGAAERIPSDRFIDGVDQTSFLLAPEGLSNRKHTYYWLGQMFSAIRVGEYKFMLASISDAIQRGVRDHVMTFRDYPPKLVVGLNV